MVPVAAQTPRSARRGVFLRPTGPCRLRGGILLRLQVLVRQHGHGSSVSRATSIHHHQTLLPLSHSQFHQVLAPSTLPIRAAKVWLGFLVVHTFQVPHVYFLQIPRGRLLPETRHRFLLILCILLQCPIPIPTFAFSSSTCRRPVFQPQEHVQFVISQIALVRVEKGRHARPNHPSHFVPCQRRIRAHFTHLLDRILVHVLLSAALVRVFIPCPVVSQIIQGRISFLSFLALRDYLVQEQFLVRTTHHPFLH